MVIYLTFIPFEYGNMMCNKIKVDPISFAFEQLVVIW